MMSILILLIVALVSIYSIHSHELGGALNSVSKHHHQHSVVAAAVAPPVNKTNSSLDDMNKESLATSPVVSTVAGEISRKVRKVEVKLRRLKKNKKTKRKETKRKSTVTNTNSADISNTSAAVERRPNGLLFMLQTFFSSMFDPTVDGRIDRSLLSRGDTPESMRRMVIPSRPNTYIPGGRRFIPGIGGSSARMIGAGGGGGSYSASGDTAGGGGGGSGASSDTAGPVCG